MSGEPHIETAGASPSVVRPYFLTKGRVRSAGGDLPIEAMVAQTGRDLAGIGYDSRQIYELCDEAISIAEIAAHMHIPLGVARVLVADLAASGHLEISKTATEADAELVQRLINGIRSL